MPLQGDSGRAWDSTPASSRLRNPPAQQLEPLSDCPVAGNHPPPPPHHRGPPPTPLPQPLSRASLRVTRCAWCRAVPAARALRSSSGGGVQRGKCSTRDSPGIPQGPHGAGRVGRRDFPRARVHGPSLDRRPHSEQGAPHAPPAPPGPKHPPRGAPAATSGSEQCTTGTALGRGPSQRWRRQAGCELLARSINPGFQGCLQAGVQRKFSTCQ